MGSLGARFEVGGGGGLVTNMLKAWNLVRKYTHTYVVLENIPFSTKALLITQKVTFSLNLSGLMFYGYYLIHF